MPNSQISADWTKSAISVIDCDAIDDIPDPKAFDQCMALEVDGEKTYATMKEVVNDDVDKLFQGTLVGVEDSSILVDEGEEVDEVLFTPK